MDCKREAEAADTGTNAGEVSKHQGDCLYSTCISSFRAQLDWEENRKAQSRFGRGAFPWEKRNLFDHLVAESDDDDDDGSYETDRKATGRRLLDTFADSLNHVNRLYNKFYGYTSRKVPAHMPHMIDRDVMEELQST